MDHNLRQALAAGDAIMNAGGYPFIPQALFFWAVVTERSWQEWMEYDKVWLLSCDALFRLPGESKGADQEVEWARQAGMAVYYDLDDLAQKLEAA